MSDALFLLETLGEPAVGDRVALTGDEGRHAAVVRRIRTGETVVLADGHGRGVRGQVVAATKAGLTVEVAEPLASPPRSRSYLAVQALAKGDRAELACEMLTEIGVDEILPWRAARSVVRWDADRAPKALARWRAAVREATKQSRRLRIPTVAEPAGTAEVCARLASCDLALVLHEEATEPIARVELPMRGVVAVVIGPEGGIAPEELDAFTAAGAKPVSLGDGVLRTSTAGVAALAALLFR